MITTALLTALCAVATMIIKIPSPMNGYMNLGDGFVLLSGWLLGPGYGFVAAGVGSALADLLSGYTVYVPGTFIIKGLVALCCAVLTAIFSGKSENVSTISLAAASTISECIMVAGYFGYAAVFMSEGLAAVASIPLNVFQAVLGIVIGICLYKVMDKIGVKENYIDEH